MNKLTKIGLSALCGSLGSISAANAGTLDVTGSATATYTSLGGQVTGNPIGMASSMTFTGNGELDGGQTFAVGIVHKNKGAYSTADLKLNTNSAGTFELSSGDGGQGIGGYDDNQPTAWEEVWGTGITTNANFQKGVSGSTNISWKSPKVIGTTVQIAYAPDNDGSTSGNKGTSGATSDHFGAGWDIVLDASTPGGEVNLFLGASDTEVAKGATVTKKSFTGDHEEGVIGLKFNLGPIAIGGQVSAERIQTQTAGAANYYGNSSWGVAFNVNDDLSISYSEAKHVQSKTKKQGWAAHGSGSVNNNEYTPKSWMRGDSIQVAYTIGGVSLKYAQTDYDNTLYTFDSKIPREVQIVAVSLAF